jgi:hypothetical protein
MAKMAAVTIDWAALDSAALASSRGRNEGVASFVTPIPLEGGFLCIDDLIICSTNQYTNQIESIEA